MKQQTMTIKTLSLFLAATIFLSSCNSVTKIQSTPSGAKVYLNGEAVGTTPYVHQDTKIVGTVTSVRLEKEGYEPFDTYISRNEAVDVGAIIGGILVLIPFLWTMKYKPIHNYELIPNMEEEEEPVMTTEPIATPATSKADKLRELKQLLDDNIITQEEFDREKKKILEENEMPKP